MGEKESRIIEGECLISARTLAEAFGQVNAEVIQAGQRIQDIVGRCVEPVKALLPPLIKIIESPVGYREIEVEVVEYIPIENKLRRSRYQTHKMADSMDEIYDRVAAPLREPILRKRQDLPLGRWLLYGHLVLEKIEQAIEQSQLRK